jgi:hypothetical protein
LLVCLMLATLAAVPAVLAADGPKVYADSTGRAGTGAGSPGEPTNPFKVGLPPDFTEPIKQLSGGTGSIVYIYLDNDGNPRWVIYPVTGGVLGPPGDSQAGFPPETGLPIAPIVWWWLAGLAAIALVVVGFFLRRRSTMQR